jgi:hypothetical protein
VSSAKDLLGKITMKVTHVGGQIAVVSRRPERAWVLHVGRTLLAQVADKSGLRRALLDRLRLARVAMIAAA